MTKSMTSKKTARRKGAAAAAVPKDGPVTLAEARALASSAAKGTVAGKASGAPLPPGFVGAARERAASQRRRELALRIREYKATMSIMKRRRARAPIAKGKAKRGGVVAKEASFVPLQIVAEGDSWFDYPIPFFGGGIVPRLEERLGVPILNLAEAGDEVRFMLGVEQRARLADQLRSGCPSGGAWDVLLFSGGGNDIVDNPMALWVRDWREGSVPGDLIHQPRFDAALALVRAGYEDLIALRDALSPGTRLVFHGYDFAIPDGRGVCHMGPWLKPTFDLRGFPDRASAFAVVKLMLSRFAEMLGSLALNPHVTFINGQGTLSAQLKSWHNELHPSRDGFDRFAGIFHERLKALFPGRVA